MFQIESEIYQIKKRKIYLIEKRKIYQIEKKKNIPDWKKKNIPDWKKEKYTRLKKKKNIPDWKKEKYTRLKKEKKNIPDWPPIVVAVDSVEESLEGKRRKIWENRRKRGGKYEKQEENMRKRRKIWENRRKRGVKYEKTGGKKGENMIEKIPYWPPIVVAVDGHNGNFAETENEPKNEIRHKK